ncbi:MAG: hypothetical protein WBB37_09475 [bacterium]
MNETADIWIFYAQNDKEFGDMLSGKIEADIPNTKVRTTSDLGEPIPYIPNIESTNIVLLVFSGSNPSGWFVAHVADAILSRTRNILIILRSHNVEIPACSSAHSRYDFTDNTEFDQTYKQLMHTIGKDLGSGLY